MKVKVNKKINLVGDQNTTTTITPTTICLYEWVQSFCYSYLKRYLSLPTMSTLIVALIVPCSLEAVHVYWPEWWRCTPAKLSIPEESDTLFGRAGLPVFVHLVSGGTRPSARQRIVEFDPSSNFECTGITLNCSCSIMNIKHYAMLTLRK